MKTPLIFNIQQAINKIKSPKAFYETEENKGNLYVTKKYKNKRSKPLTISLPKEVIISPEVVGLIVGEGFIGSRAFIFANSNDKAIREVLQFLKQFKIHIKSYLEISIKNKHKEFIGECIDFWKSNFKEINISKIKLRKEFNNITKYGTIHVSIYNTIISELLGYIIRTSKEKIEKDRDLSIEYLKGILAAEGNINVKKKTNCVYMVRISASKPEEREHYKRCLEKIGIKISCKDMPTISKQEAKQKKWKTTKGRAGAVIISKWDNFIKILELGLLELHEDKKDKFMIYFLNNKFTKQFLDFGYFINKEFTMKQAQSYFDLSGRHLNRVLTFWKKGYISRRQVNKVKFVYQLTEKYSNLYKELSQIPPSING